MGNLMNRGGELPKNASTLKNQGEIKRLNGDYNGALTNFDRAAQLAPDDASIYKLRGETKRMLGDFKGALEDFEKANVMEPGNGFTLSGLGDTKRTMGDYQGALDAFNQANDSQPNLAFTLRCRGATKRMLSDFSGALEDLNRSDQLEPDNAFTISHRGATKWHLDLFKEALVDLNRADELESNNPDILLYRAYTKRMLGDEQGEREDLEKANQIELSNDPFAIRCLGETKCMLGDYFGALKELNKAHQLLSNDVFILRDRAIVLYHSEEYPSALADIRKALTMLPSDPVSIKWKNDIEQEYQESASTAAKSNRNSALLLANSTGSEGSLKASCSEPMLSIEESTHVPYSEVTVLKTLGEGGSGEVSLAHWRGFKVALKKLKSSEYVNQAIDISPEAKTLLQLRYKYIVMFHGITADPVTNNAILIMEYMKHGSLEDMLFKQHVKLSRTDVLRLALDIALGVNYLHSQNPKILHRDLKSANVLLHRNRRRAKIADFGTAVFLPEDTQAKTVIGALGIAMPPEMATEQPYNEKVDVFAFGVILYELLTVQRLPVLDEIHRVARIRENIHDADMVQLVLDCCMTDPAKRPHMRDIVELLRKMKLQREDSILGEINKECNPESEYCDKIDQLGYLMKHMEVKTSTQIEILYTTLDSWPNAKGLDTDKIITSANPFPKNRQMVHDGGIFYFVSTVELSLHHNGQQLQYLSFVQSKSYLYCLWIEYTSHAIIEFWTSNGEFADSLDFTPNSHEPEFEMQQASTTPPTNIIFLDVGSSQPENKHQANDSLSPNENQDTLDDPNNFIEATAVDTRLISNSQCLCYTRVKDVGSKLSPGEQRNTKIIKIAQPLPANNSLPGRSSYWFVTTEETKISYQDKTLFNLKEMVTVTDSLVVFYLFLIEFKKDKEGTIQFHFSTGDAIVRCYSKTRAAKKQKLTHPTIYEHFNTMQIEEYQQHFLLDNNTNLQWQTNSDNEISSAPHINNILLLVPKRDDLTTILHSSLVNLKFKEEATSQNQSLYSKMQNNFQRHVLMFPYMTMEGCYNIQDYLPHATEVILMIENEAEQEHDFMVITKLNSIYCNPNNNWSFTLKTNSFAEVTLDYNALQKEVMQVLTVNTLKEEALGGVSWKKSLEVGQLTNLFTQFFFEWTLDSRPTKKICQNIFLCFKYEKEVKAMTDYAKLTLEVLGFKQNEDFWVAHGSVLVYLCLPSYTPWYILERSEEIFQILGPEGLQDIYECFISDVEATMLQAKNEDLYDDLAHLHERMICDGIPANPTATRFRVTYKGKVELETPHSVQYIAANFLSMNNMQQNQKVIEKAKPIPEDGQLLAQATYWFITTEKIEISLPKPSLVFLNEQIEVKNSAKIYYLSQVAVPNRQGSICFTFSDGCVVNVDFKSCKNQITIEPSSSATKTKSLERKTNMNTQY